MDLRLRDDALSEVVGFVLILGVIVVALSLYQAYGVPAAGRENEIAHMNHVKNRFVDYKLALDSLWVNNQSGVLLSMAFDLGTEAPATRGKAFSLPILTPVGSGGSVSVEEGGTKLTIEPAGEEPVTISLGSLIYESSNRYWVDQTWIYQGGAVFLSQEGGRPVVRVGPSVSVYNDTNGNTHLTVAPISLEGSNMIAGSGPVRIETRMRLNKEHFPDENYNQVNLAIEAGDKVTALAWKSAFDEVRMRAVDEGVNGSSLSVHNNSENRVWLTVKQPMENKKVILAVHPAKYTVTLHGAASLME